MHVAFFSSHVKIKKIMSTDPKTFSARIEHHLGVLNFHGEMNYPFDDALIGVAQAFEIVSASGFLLRRGVRLQHSTALTDYAFSGTFEFVAGCLRLYALTDTLPVYTLSGAILRGITDFKRWVEVDTSDAVRHAIKHASTYLTPSKKRKKSRPKREFSAVVNLPFQITYPFDLSNIAIGMAFQLTGPCGSALSRGVRIQRTPDLKDFFSVGKSRAVCKGQPLDLLQIPPCEPLYECDAVRRGLRIEPIPPGEFQKWLTHVPRAIISQSQNGDNGLSTTPRRSKIKVPIIPLSHVSLPTNVYVPIPHTTHDDSIPHCYPPKKYRMRLAFYLLRDFLRTKFPGEKI